MDKALLGSILLAAVIIPVRAARHADPRRGLRNAVLGVVAFNFVYLALLRFIYPRVL